MTKDQIIEHVMSIYKLEPSVHIVEDFVRLAVNMAWVQGSIESNEKIFKLLKGEHNGK